MIRKLFHTHTCVLYFFSFLGTCSTQLEDAVVYLDEERAELLQEETGPSPSGGYPSGWSCPGLPPSGGHKETSTFVHELAQLLQSIKIQWNLSINGHPWAENLVAALKRCLMYCILLLFHLIAIIIVI